MRGWQRAVGLVSEKCVVALVGARTWGYAGGVAGWGARSSSKAADGWNRECDSRKRRCVTEALITVVVKMSGI